MDHLHFADPRLFRCLVDSRVLDIIEDFIGPDIVLWSSHFIAKPPRDRLAVPWHTDGAYRAGKLEPTPVITLWLAVDDSRVDNGCMRVIDGSHRELAAEIDWYEPVNGSRFVFGRQLPPALTDQGHAVDLEREVGEAHFHDAPTVHASNPNTSARRRCGYTMRYMPAFAVHTPWEGHHIHFVRGCDRSGGRNRYARLPTTD